MRYLRGALLLSLFVMAGAIGGQMHTAAQPWTQAVLDSMQRPTDEEILRWFGELYTMGVDVREDSLVVAAEVLHLLRDSQLRAEVYPQTYRWERTVELLEAKELKKAFWFMINHYLEDNNRELVVRCILRYDEVLAMDRALLSAFYTYAVLDPRVSDIDAEGRVEVRRPDLLEAKMEGLRELVQYLAYYGE